MKFTSSFKMIVGAAAVTAITGVANAAPVTFADVSLSGSVSYTAEKNLIIWTTPAFGSVGGAFSANLYGDTSVVRDYTLEYSFSSTWDGATQDVQGAYAIPFAFSIDSIVATLPPVPSTPGGVLPVLPLGGIFSYTGLDVTQDSITGAFTFSFIGNGVENLLVSWGLPEFSGDFSGSYSANLALVADVLPAAIPLPAAAPLLVFGIGGLVAFGRKRRKTA